MEIDPTRMCELLVGLPDVDVVGVDDPEPGRLVVMVEPREARPVCGRCSTPAWVKDRREVDLVDLPAFDQCVVLRVIRTRWRCPRFRCGIGSWTLKHHEIAPAGHRLTTRAGRWVREQVGRYARSVSEVADALGCDSQTVNDAVVAYGEALIGSDTDRIGVVRALSLDETLFMRERPWRTQRWSTQLTDARTGQLLDVVPGRDSAAPATWLAEREPEWLGRIASMLHVMTTKLAACGPEPCSRSRSAGRAGSDRLGDYRRRRPQRTQTSAIGSPGHPSSAQRSAPTFGQPSAVQRARPLPNPHLVDDGRPPAGDGVDDPDGIGGTQIVHGQDLFGDRFVVEEFRP